MTIAWLPPQFAEGLGDDALWNAVAGLAGDDVALDEQGTTVSFALGDAPPDGASWVVECLDGDGKAAAFVHFREFPFGPLFEVELTTEALSAQPPGLRDALVEGMFNYVAMASVPDAQPRPRIGRQGMLSSFADAAGPAIQWFDIRLAVSGALVALHVACRRDLAARIVAQFASARPAAQAAIAGRLSVPVDFTLGSIELPLRDAVTLEPGAIAVLGAAPAGGVAVRLQGMVLDFEPAEQGWICKANRPVERPAARRMEARMDSDEAIENEVAENEAEPAEPATEGDGLAIGDLRIAIDFDIGRRMVPVGELSAWQPGAIVQLDPPAIADGVEVTIRANGDVVGSGDIVRVDDRLAVRITRLSLRD